jgi:hypothetical protein
MADFNAPTNTSTYSTVLSTLNDKISSVAKMNYSGDTNIPTGALRLNTTTGFLESWSGSAWTLFGFILLSESTTAALWPVTSFFKRGDAAAFNTLNAQNTSGVHLRLTANANSEARVEAVSNHPLDVFTNNTARARFHADGGMSVGTTSKSGQFLVRGIGTTTDVTFRTQNSSGVSAFSVLDSGSTTIQGNNTGGETLTLYRYDSSAVGPGIVFGAAKSNTIGTNTIVANGDQLGRMDFYGANGTNFTSSVRLLGFVDGTPAAGSNNMPGGFLISTSPGGGVGLTERFRVSANGVVGVNDTTSASARLRARATSSSIAYAALLATDYSGDLTYPVLQIEKYDNNSTSSQVFVRFIMNKGGAGTGSGQIVGGGANQAAFGSYSDERFKENIEPLGDELSKIKNLRPVEFDYRDGSGHQVGFIAQEVLEVYPELVSPDQDGMLMLAGLGRTEARLIRAIQQLAERVEQLELSRLP